MIDTPFVLVVVYSLLALAALTIGAITWVLYKMDSNTLKETSRFRLFAARDELRLLVCNGEMKEDDPAWQIIHTGVNSLLSLGESHNIASITFKRILLLRKVKLDTKTQTAMKVIWGYLNRRIEEIPGFRIAVINVLNGYEEMVRKRSRPRHWAVALPMIWMLGVWILVRQFKFNKRKKQCTCMELPQLEPQVEPSPGKPAHTISPECCLGSSGGATRISNEEFHATIAAYTNKNQDLLAACGAT